MDARFHKLNKMRLIGSQEIIQDNPTIEMEKMELKTMGEIIWKQELDWFEVVSKPFLYIFTDYFYHQFL
jgi:hypothetical protein